MSVVKNILDSEALRTSVKDFTDRWMVSKNDYLNIYDNLTESDFEKIQRSGLIKGVAFAKKFHVENDVLKGINGLFFANPLANYSLCLNGFDAFDDLTHLQYLSNLKHLRVTVFNGSDLEPINDYLSLESLSIDGNKTDLMFLKR